jgi:hypothetical protein
MQWDPVWGLCRPLGGHFPVTAGERLKHSHQRGVGGIVYACGALGHMDCCGTHKSDSLVRAS